MKIISKSTRYGHLILDIIILVVVLIFMLAKHHNIMFDWAVMVKLFGIYLKVFFLVLLTWLLVSYFTNLYESNRYSPFVERIRNLVGQWSVFFVLFLTISGLTETQFLFLNESIVFCTIGLVFQMIYRIIYFRYRKGRKIRGDIYTPILVLDENDNLQNYLNFFEERKDFGLKVKKVLKSRVDIRTELFEEFSEQTMTKVIKEEKISQIYICLNGKFTDEQINKVIKIADEFYLKTYFIPYRLYDKNQDLQLTSYGSHPILTEKEHPLDDQVNQLIKRVFDIVFSLLVIIGIMSWLTPLIAFLIYRNSGFPIFFAQKRNGLNGREFDCLKFRTMYPNKESDTVATVRGDARITPIGNFLRKTSLDEMPQFFNVLWGDMSVVGPRPQMVSQNEHFSNIINRYTLRHYVKPGITGLAQMNGYRGAIDSDRDMILRVESDVYYVRHWSFILDIWIIIKTALNIIQGDKNAI